jgi:hypothetical protein
MLIVNNKETALQQLNASVLQGSPLSLILFLFYNALLLEAVNQLDLPIALLGFADDINLLMYSKTTAVNCTNLKTAHNQCIEWASTYRMQFAPNKYTLTYFTRRRGFNVQAPVTL